MKMVFHFPVTHDSCGSCSYRFQCLTMRIHKEYEFWFGNRKRYLQEILPFKFGLKCFSIKPYNRVTRMKLELCDDKESMVVEISWN